MREIPVGMASVNGRPPVPLKDAVEEIVNGLSGRRGRVRAAAPEAPATDAANAGEKPPQDIGETGGIAADRLRSIVERIERLEEERKALSDDIKDIVAEAKSAGFDVKALRQVIRMRTWEPAVLEEHEALVELYRRALGM